MRNIAAQHGFGIPKRDSGLEQQPTEDYDYELHEALLSDEAFGAAVSLYDQASIFADDEAAVATD